VGVVIQLAAGFLLHWRMWCVARLPQPSPQHGLLLFERRPHPDFSVTASPSPFRGRSQETTCSPI
jgi:hypothetical protein